MAELTKKQKRFVQEYLIDLNATAAARRAGYSEKTARCIGNENLTKPAIKAEIDRELAKIQSDRIATADEVMRYLTAVMRGEQTEEIPLLQGDGMPALVAKDVSATDRLKAAELIGKRYGLFTEKLGLDGVVPVILAGDDEVED